MPKTGGDITKAKILEVAENLFSEKGFDATSIDTIAKAVGINKATIYYHFKDKNDILVSLFQAIIDELNHHLKKGSSSNSIQDSIKEEIVYLQNKRKILSILLMEALKDTDTKNVLFHCAKTVIMGEMTETRGNKPFENIEEEQLYYIHEFFTGFIPMIAFIVFQDKWCDFFNGNKKTSIDDFIEVFHKTHLTSHFK